MTHSLLWPDFQAHWPLIVRPDGATNGAMGWQGLPFINTVILIISSITLHAAHKALTNNNRAYFQYGLLATIGLALVFLILQAVEYQHAYQQLELTLSSGIYGNTFYLLTGFHGLHVLLGMTVLIVIYSRARRGHFTSQQHFAVQAGSWYWHFVDVVWLNLFIFVYVL